MDRMAHRQHVPIVPTGQEIVRQGWNGRWSMETRWMNVRQVAEHYNCSIDVIYSDLKAGRLEGEQVVKNGGKQKYWIVDRAKLPAVRGLTCTICHKPLGVGESMVLTKIQTMSSGRKEVKGTDGRFCSEWSLFRRCHRKLQWWQRWISGGER